jgi:hypothetical protein
VSFAFIVRRAARGEQGGAWHIFAFLATWRRPSLSPGGGVSAPCGPHRSSVLRTQKVI